MNLKDLKQKSPADLVAMAEELGVEGASTLRKQDIMFSILKILAENGEQIMGLGTIEDHVVGLRLGGEIHRERVHQLVGEPDLLELRCMQLGDHASPQLRRRCDNTCSRPYLAVGLKNWGR